MAVSFISSSQEISPYDHKVKIIWHDQSIRCEVDEFSGSGLWVEAWWLILNLDRPSEGRGGG